MNIDKSVQQNSKMTIVSYLNKFALLAFLGGLRLLTRGQLTDMSLNTLFTEITTIHETMEVIR